MNYRRIGGLAALGQAAAYVCFLVLVVFLLPAVGGYALSDFTDPTQILRKAALHPGAEPLLLAIDMLSIAFGILPLLIMVGLIQRISKISASERYLILGFIVVNTALWLATAAIDSAGLPRFLQLYGQNAEQAQIGYLVLGTITLQLGNAAAGAYGLALLVMSMAAWRTKAFARSFIVLSFIWGVIAVLSWPFVIFGALGTIVGLVWCLWLGWLFFQPQPTELTLAGA